MKAIIEFQLPEDNEEHKHAINGLKYYCGLEELDDVLRKKLKYTDETTIDIEEVRRFISEVLHDC